MTDDPLFWEMLLKSVLMILFLMLVGGLFKK